MLKLSGLTPVGVRHIGNDARLTWQLDGAPVETDFQRFLPIGVDVSAKRRELEVTWRDFADLNMNDESFFERTAASALNLTVVASQFRTMGDTLSVVAKAPEVLRLSGATFHMARTGSTLIHRLLSRTGKVLSLSEIITLDRVMKLTANWPVEERDAAIRDFAGVFGRRRRPNEKHFVMKMTDGSSLFMPTFLSAFPTTPWIFVYRDPIEVMASMLAVPTGNVQTWYKNRTDLSRWLGMPVLNDPGMWPAEFMARTLRRFCLDAVRSARVSAPNTFLAVNYSRLPDAIWETIAPHFNIDLTEEDRSLMLEEARYASKKKDNVEFVPDSEVKQAKATPFIRELAKKFVEPAIEQLKALPQG